MSRPRLGDLLAACAVAAPAAAAVAAPAPAEEPALVQSCTTTTLPLEAIAAGARSEVSCTWVPADAATRMVRSGYIAVHYDGSSGSGAQLAVGGSCSGGISFAPSDPWDDRISSTGHRVCGTIKHYTNRDYTGGPQVTEGGLGVVLNLGAWVSNQVSSVVYAA